MKTITMHLVHNPKTSIAGVCALAGIVWPEHREVITMICAALIGLMTCDAKGKQ